MNTIIFLDIDGVLKHPTKNIWYPEAIEYLNSYCSHNNIDIVISSTWRLIKNIEFFNNILNNRVIGITDDLSKFYQENTRYYECMKYVKQYKIKNYIMIDDLSEEYVDLSRFVKINPHVGIDLKTILKMNTILKTDIDYLVSEKITVKDRLL